MKRLFLVAALALSCASCACMNRFNQPLLNLCRKHLVPEGAVAAVAVSPVVLPVCLAAGVLDVTLAHPLSTVDDAWLQTEALLWQPTERGYVTECALLPFRSAATPPVWLLDVLQRSLFDVPRWPPGAGRLERDLRDDDPRLRLLAVRDLAPKSYAGDDAEAVTRVMIAACRAHKTDQTLCETLIERLPAPLTDDALAYLTELASTGRGRRCAAAIGRLFLGCAYGAQDDAEAKQAARALETAASVYDALVESGHREAELFLADRAGRYAYRWWRVRALAFHIVRSLARRNWPDYAERATFTVQVGLLSCSKAAHLEAMDAEWRALRVHPRWPEVVAAAVARFQAAPGAVTRRAALVRQQNVIAERLRDPATPAEELLRLHENLVDIKTLLDAEELAERLVEHTDDLRLFMADPLELLRAKGEP